MRLSDWKTEIDSVEIQMMNRLRGSGLPGGLFSPTTQMPGSFPDFGKPKNKKKKKNQKESGSAKKYVNPAGDDEEQRYAEGSERDAQRYAESAERYAEGSERDTQRYAEGSEQPARR